MYTDKIFSFSGTFPAPPYALDKNGNPVYFRRNLKAVDSYLVQEYYIDTVNNIEVLQGFNISDGSNNVPAGSTSLGINVSGPYKIQGETLMDFVIPLSSTVTST